MGADIGFGGRYLPPNFSAGKIICPQINFTGKIICPQIIPRERWKLKFQECSKLNIWEKFVNKFNFPKNVLYCFFIVLKVHVLKNIEIFRKIACGAQHYNVIMYAIICWQSPSREELSRTFEIYFLFFRVLLKKQGSIIICKELKNGRVSFGLLVKKAKCSPKSGIQRCRAFSTTHSYGIVIFRDGHSCYDFKILLLIVCYVWLTCGKNNKSTL